MIPGDVLKDLQDGRLSQRCPAPGCPVIEAAGGYSTCHNVPTGPADWFRQTLGDVQRARLTQAARAANQARAIQSGGAHPRRRPGPEQSALAAILAPVPTPTQAA